ncbi:Protein T27A10.6, partial [Aphelenchoides avenae]
PLTEASEPPPALFGAVQPAAATDYDDDLGDNGGFPSWPMASDIARLPLKQEHTPPPYDIAAFYRTAPPPKRPQLRQKVLTFCTKENAIRDQNNLIVACGGDTDVWYPNRCPPGTDCFVAPDSSFRICCPVGK